MSRREYLFRSIPLKPQIFIPLKWEEWERIELDLMIFFFIKTPKIPLYIQPFILKYGSNSNIVIK